MSCSADGSLRRADFNTCVFDEVSGQCTNVLLQMWNWFLVTEIINWGLLCVGVAIWIALVNAKWRGWIDLCRTGQNIPKFKRIVIVIYFGCNRRHLSEPWSKQKYKMQIWTKGKFIIYTKTIGLLRLFIAMIPLNRDSIKRRLMLRYWNESCLLKRN
jgi:hypothetical protein